MEHFFPSYTIEKKTIKILKLKKELNRQKPIPIVACLSAVLSVSYIAFSHQRYFDYTVAVATNAKKLSANFLLVDLAIIILLIFSYYIIHSSSIKRKKLKADYESLRKDLIKSINNEFCNCSKSCSCKDDYIKGMEEEGIDLVF